MESWQFIQGPAGEWYWLCSNVISRHTREKHYLIQDTHVVHRKCDELRLSKNGRWERGFREAGEPQRRRTGKALPAPRQGCPRPAASNCKPLQPAITHIALQPEKIQQATETKLALAAVGKLNMDQWEFLQTRSVKWKWRQLGAAGAVVSESPEFAFLAHCMKDAELNGFSVDDHIISTDKSAVLWSDPPEQPV